MSVKQIFNTSAELDYPTVLPTLDLDFANSKTLDPRITFTRASGGSYVGADGLIKLAGVNEARFDHDPYTGESLGLLVEEARTNLLLRSEEFGTTWAANRSSILTNTVIAPNGTFTADTFVEDSTASASHVVFQTPNLGVSFYSISVYARALTRTQFYLRIDTSTSTRIVLFNLSDVTAASLVSGISGTISSVGGGWYRCTATLAAAETCINAVIGLALNGNTAYTGDGTSGIFIWGAQLEQGSFPTSYIPTEASTRTRAADNARIIGKNFSDFYRPDEGTVYADTKINGVQTTNFDRLWAITNANLNFEGISISISGPSSSSYVFSISVTNSAIEQLGGGLIETAFTTPRLKSVFALKQDNCAGAVNGQQRIVDNTVDLSLFTTPVDRLLIGQPQRFQGTSCMTIRRLTYYPKRLPNSQLITLTS